MSFEIKHGDWIDVLRTVPDESVQCVVTSPPYYGLRDYGTATWEGGDEGHEHDRIAARNGRMRPCSTWLEGHEGFPVSTPLRR